MTRILLWTGGIPQNVPVKTRQRFSMKTVLSDQAVFRFLPSESYILSTKERLSDMLPKIRDIQKEFPAEKAPIRTALVTARSAPAHERVIRTLRAWNVRIDEAFFLGGITKRDVLKAFGAHIFFDDQALHTQSASEVVPAARVPYRKRNVGEGTDP